MVETKGIPGMRRCLQVVVLLVVVAAVEQCNEIHNPTIVPTVERSRRVLGRVIDCWEQPNQSRTIMYDIWDSECVAATVDGHVAVVVVLVLGSDQSQERDDLNIPNKRRGDRPN